MGYGLITVKNNTITLLELGVLKPGKIEDSYKKLQLIFNTVSGLITKYQPTDFAIEARYRILSQKGKTISNREWKCR